MSFKFNGITKAQLINNILFRFDSVVGFLRNLSINTNTEEQAEKVSENEI